MPKPSPVPSRCPVMVSGDASAAMPRGVVRSRAAPSPPDPGPQLPRPVWVRSAGLGFVPPYKAHMQPQTVPHGGAESFLLCAPRATLPVPPYTSPYYTHFRPGDPESDGAFPNRIGIQLPLGPKTGFAGSRSWLVWPRECPDPGSPGPDSWGYLGALGGHLT